MLHGIDAIDEAINVDSCALTLRAFNFLPKLIRVDTIRKAEVNLRPRFAVGDVIALILREWLAKVPSNIIWLRMHLYREIAAFDGIQIVETDWEVVAKFVCRAAQHLAIILEHQQVKRAFKMFAAAF